MNETLPVKEIATYIWAAWMDSLETELISYREQARGGTRLTYLQGRS